MNYTNSRNVNLFRVKRIVLIFVFLFYCLSEISAQQDKRHITVENLRSEWLVLSNERNQLTPYIKEIHSPTSIHVLLNLNKYSEYHLVIEVPEKASLFIENQIVAYQKSLDVLHLSIDSLKAIYEKDQIVVSVFSKKNLSEKLKIIIKDFDPYRGESFRNVDLSSDLRSQYSFGDFGILSILIIMIFGISLQASQGYIFNEYFNLKKVISLKPKSEILYSVSLFSTQNLLFMMFYGVTMGFSITNLIARVAPNALIQYGYMTTFKVFLLAFVLSLIFTLFMILKYLQLKLITDVFMFRKATPIHFYEYLRFTMIISFTFFLLALVNNFSQGMVLNRHLMITTYLFVFLLIVRSILIFFKLNKLQTFRKLHLFSYLCSTEIIPLIILLKIFSIYIGVF